MNRLIITRCLLTATIVAGSVAAAPAQQITTSQLFGRGDRCDHVIELIHRHGVNNSVNGFASRAMFHHSPLGGVVIDEADVGDLQVVEVSQIVHKDSSCGPRFAVLIRNESCRSVRKFHVSAVAVFGRVCPASPHTTVAVEEIAAGETLQVELTLPIEAFAMGKRNGQVVGLQRLVVAIDSFDELLETNEANNLKAFEIDQIPVLTSAVETAVESVPEVDSAATQAEPPGRTAETDSSRSGVATQTAKPPADPLRSAISKLAVQQPE